jgi:hypothetical protein
MSNITHITPAAVTFTREAQETMVRIRDRIDSIRHWHNAEVAGAAGLTLATSLASLIVMGGTVYGDRIGDTGLLNLIAHTESGLTVGMIFFAETLSAEDQERFPGIVEAGTWSLHS